MKSFKGTVASGDAHSEYRYANSKTNGLGSRIGAFADPCCATNNHSDPFPSQYRNGYYPNSNTKRNNSRELPHYHNYLFLFFLFFYSSRKHQKTNNIRTIVLATLPATSHSRHCMMSGRKPRIVWDLRAWILKHVGRSVQGSYGRSLCPERSGSRPYDHAGQDRICDNLLNKASWTWEQCCHILGHWL